MTPANILDKSFPCISNGSFIWLYREWVGFQLMPINHTAWSRLLFFDSSIHCGLIKRAQLRPGKTVSCNQTQKGPWSHSERPFPYSAGLCGPHQVVLLASPPRVTSGLLTPQWQEAVWTRYSPVALPSSSMLSVFPFHAHPSLQPPQHRTPKHI